MPKDATSAAATAAIHDAITDALAERREELAQRTPPALAARCPSFAQIYDSLRDRSDGGLEWQWESHTAVPAINQALKELKSLRGQTATPQLQEWLDDWIGHLEQFLIQIRLGISVVLDEARQCVECHKRPRHFDDLCKKCANDMGLRPRGRIT